MIICYEMCCSTCYHQFLLERKKIWSWLPKLGKQFWDRRVEISISCPSDTEPGKSTSTTGLWQHSSTLSQEIICLHAAVVSAHLNLTLSQYIGNKITPLGAILCSEISPWFSHWRHMQKLSLFWLDYKNPILFYALKRCFHCFPFV